MDKCDELHSQLRKLSEQFLAGNLSDEELVENRQAVRGTVKEIMDISAEQDRGRIDNLPVAGATSQEFIDEMAKKGIIFRKIER